MKESIVGGQIFFQNVPHYIIYQALHVPTPPLALTEATANTCLPPPRGWTGQALDKTGLRQKKTFLEFFLTFLNFRAHFFEFSCSFFEFCFLNFEFSRKKFDPKSGTVGTPLPRGPPEGSPPRTSFTSMS